MSSSWKTRRTTNENVDKSAKLSVWKNQGNVNRIELVMIGVPLLRRHLRGAGGHDPLETGIAAVPRT